MQEVPQTAKSETSRNATVAAAPEGHNVKAGDYSGRSTRSMERATKVSGMRPPFAVQTTGFLKYRDGDGPSEIAV